jgi:membrane protease YdiL (CAAX protease family)
MQEQETSTATRINPSTVALWEIISVSVSCLIVEWVLLAFVGRNKFVLAMPIGLALLLMLYSHKEYGETLREIGFRLDNFVAATKLLLVPTIAAIAIIVWSSWFTSGDYFDGRLPRARFLLVPLWALFQQYALQGFINRRAQIVLGQGWKSIVFVALLFGVVHLPNPMLFVFTLVGGLIWAAVYQKEPNLYALTLSHAAASVVVSLFVPLELINSLRVGLKYFG